MHEFLTIDTNVVVNAGTNDDDAGKIVQQFLAEDSSFLTPQVHEELTRLDERYTWFTRMLTDRMEETGAAPRPAWDSIRSEFSDELDHTLEQAMNQIIDYYDSRYSEGDSIDTLERKLKDTFSIFIEQQGAVRPDPSTFQEHPTTAVMRKANERFDLVPEHDEDIVIASQVYHALRAGTVQLITDDTGYRPDADQWALVFPGVTVDSTAGFFEP